MATFERTKSVRTARAHLKSLGGFGINGKIIAPDVIVEVSDFEAKDLIQRNKAVDATPAEVTAAGANIEVAPIRGGSAQWQDV